MKFVHCKLEVIPRSFSFSANLFFFRTFAAHLRARQKDCHLRRPPCLDLSWAPDRALCAVLICMNPDSTQKISGTGKSQPL